MRLRFRIYGLATYVVLSGAAAQTVPAQQLIGYVNTRDAEVTGASDVLAGQAVLTGSVGVTARDHTAPITLGRGGTVRVCQTSALHVTESKSAEIAAPLLFSLDRGAIEIHMNATLNDSIMTPELRFTIINRGALDLRMRVARNGDTCVENRGPNAPTLNISDPFGEALYQVSAGQHVLFEHGNLHEVVDHEQTPCGCPDEKGMSVADALLASGGGKTVAPPAPTLPAVQVAATPAAVVQTPAQAAAQPAAQAAARPATQAETQAELRSAEQTAAHAAVSSADQHPFPAAVSEGLTPEPEVPQAAAGTVHAQITDRLSYDAGAGAAATAQGNQAGDAKTPVAAAAPAPAVAKPPAKDFAHVVGRFFKRLFGG